MENIKYKDDFKIKRGGKIKEYQISIDNSSIIVNNKKCKINYRRGFVYKINKTSISTSSTEELIKFIKTGITNFKNDDYCWFTHILNLLDNVEKIGI